MNCLPTSVFPNESNKMTPPPIVIGNPEPIVFADTDGRSLFNESTSNEELSQSDEELSSLFETYFEESNPENSFSYPELMGWDLSDSQQFSDWSSNPIQSEIILLLDSFFPAVRRRNLVLSLDNDLGSAVTENFIAPEVEEEGIVLSFKDSVVTISGLDGVKANELIFFSGGAIGVALNLEYEIVKALVFGNANSVDTGERVTRSKVVMRVGVGSQILGRVLNPLGLPIDGFGSIVYDEFKSIEKKAPGVITRKKINQPVETGLKIVDSLVPIGRGQRELILGDRKTGKTTIAIDAILNQLASLKKLSQPIYCIYVAVGKRMAEVVRLNRLLRAAGAMSYTSLVVARASDPAALQFIAPYSACTMAEYFTYRGAHALIIYDDLTRHADAYRQLSLLLRRPVGREAYPGDIFYLHSRLLERAVKLDLVYGGGSLTALPIVETVQGDVSAYIPTNVISITDGQIYLDLDRHQEGVRPAVDPGLSVSRVGSSAQSKLMKKLSGSLKLELAQFREVEQFSKFGSELDSATRNLLFKGRMMIELLKQPRNLPLPVVKQIIMFYVCKSEFFNENILPRKDFTGEQYFNSLFSYIDSFTLLAPLVASLDREKDIPNAVILKSLIEIHFTYFFLPSTDKPLLPAISEIAYKHLTAASSGVVVDRTVRRLAQVFIRPAGDVNSWIDA